jgi:D-alanyl-lipoteichoic acid acyltransferase DltB (MBOAT superfamily)
LAAVYPFFLYANFSGYIDIVIALARLMRLRLPENFDLPFAAPSFIEFWNRWHITLSTWLKTYVFNPLLIALMRRISNPDIQPFLGVFCFFVTFFLVGIWHGRTSEFAVFGALQGGGVAINKLWQVFLSRRLGNARYKKFTKQPISIAVGRGLTFTWFAFTLFWFWADWKQINSIFSALSVAEWCAVWLTLWLSATVIFEAFERLRAAVLSVNTSEGPMITSRYARVVRASALAFISLVAVLVLDQPAPVIVYKTF